MLSHFQTIIERRQKFIEWILAILFGISCRQYLLYSSNQNAYFLQGLAEAGVGNLLSNDFLANTTTPFPVFSYLITMTKLYLGEVFFHIYYVVLLSIFIYSIMRIVSVAFNLKTLNGIYLLMFCGFLLINTGYDTYHAIISYSYTLLSYEPNTKIYNIYKIFIDGVAGQRILSFIFQPSTFGILLIYSIYKFLDKKVVISTVLIAVTIWFHSTYLLSGGLIVLSYILYFFLKKQYKRGLIIGIIPLVLIIPILGYLYYHFQPTSEAESILAREILVHFRIPHHAVINEWFSYKSIIKILLIILSIFLVRKEKRLFMPMLVLFLGGMFLSLVQYFTQSDFLALMFPWRVSVILVPLSSAICLCKLVLYVSKVVRHGRQRQIQRFYLKEMVIVFSIIYIMYIAYSGFNRFYQRIIHNDYKLDSPMMTYVRNTLNDNDIYLIPPEFKMQYFRLNTGASIFIDHKTHPLKDIEVIEWYNRLKIANKIYADKPSCQLIEPTLTNYHLTHFLSYQAVDCDFLELAYKDESYFIYIKIDNK